MVKEVIMLGKTYTVVHNESRERGAGSFDRAPIYKVTNMLTITKVNGCDVEHPLTMTWYDDTQDIIYNTKTLIEQAITSGRYELTNRQKFEQWDGNFDKLNNVY